MDTSMVIVIALAALFILWRLLPVKGVRQMTTAELKRELTDTKKQFIDVRTVGEFKGSHIRGFRNLPLQELPSYLNELSKEREVVVICQSGMRSGKASQILKKAGFPKVANVKGGMSAWRA